MKYFEINIFIILYTFYIKKTFQSYVIYPFKKSTKEKKLYPENLIQNDLEITLEIGIPPQKINLNIRSKVYTFFISSTETKLPYATFNAENSITLIKETKNPEIYLGQEYYEAYKIYESIKINEKEIKNISLILANSVLYKESGALGLRLIDSHEFSGDLSFIYQIKEPANFDNYAFTLKYDNDEKGKLIIGSYPHLYDKKYNENNFYYTRTGYIGNNLDWVLDFDSISYDNKIIRSIKTKSLISIEFGLIQAPFKLKNYFNDNFFKNKCKEKFYLARNITIIHCDKNFNIANFKNLSFLLKDIDYEFILTYKDLFIEENEEYIFSIVFDNITNDKDAIWILGKPFMKKYQLVYDLDRKIIGFYGNKTWKKKNNNNLYIYISLIIILSLIVIGLIIYIIYIFINQRRKKAFELNDDNFDYIPSN